MTFLSQSISRFRGKLLRELSPYVDSYSLYYNRTPFGDKVQKLSHFAQVGTDTKVTDTIVVPSPAYVELGSNVELKHLKVNKGLYAFIESDVKAPNGIACDAHTIVTKNGRYSGESMGGSIVTLSVDFEAGVALSHAPRDRWHYYRKFWNSKSCVQRLAELFKKYRIPVTWAICGHLFYDRCTGNHGFDGEDDWFGDWFHHDPCSSVQRDASWYMSDVIEQLMKVPYFEIGYHTFGHFRYRHCTKKSVQRDMALAEEIRKQWGLKLDTFVYPHNECGYFDLIRDGGFKNIRGNIGKIYPSYGAIDFKEFKFFNTTQMVAPATLDTCLNQLGAVGGNFSNYYTHCYQWAEHDGWHKLDEWLKGLAQQRECGHIEIKCIGDFCL